MEAGAIREEDYKGICERCWNALSAAATAQEKYQEADEPARRFIELVIAALTSGRGHFAAPSGGEPAEADLWGWRSEPGQLERRARGERIGWVTDDDIYLDPETAFAVAQKFARDQGDAFSISAQTLRKRLKERGYLASYGGANRETLMVRRVLEGKTRSVLHLQKNLLVGGLSSYKKPDIPDISPNAPETDGFIWEKPDIFEGEPDKPDIDLTMKTSMKTDTCTTNVRNVRFFQQQNLTLEETPDRNVRFFQQQNLTLEETPDLEEEL
jgi:hypothetical protein